MQLHYKNDKDDEPLYNYEDLQKELRKSKSKENFLNKEVRKFIANKKKRKIKRK